MRLFFKKVQDLFFNKKKIESSAQRVANINKFDENSDRAKNGLRFQKQVFSELHRVFDNVEFSRDYYKKQNPMCSEYDLNMMEQFYGDIVVTFNNTPIFIECVSINVEVGSPFPGSKIRNFKGKDKFYVFGWDGFRPKYIHSGTWNAYAKKIPEFNRNGRKFRKIGRWMIKNIKNGVQGTSEFRNLFEA